MLYIWVFFPEVSLIFQASCLPPSRVDGSWISQGVVNPCVWEPGPPWHGDELEAVKNWEETPQMELHQKRQLSCLWCWMLKNDLWIYVYIYIYMCVCVCVYIHICGVYFLDFPSMNDNLVALEIGYLHFFLLLGLLMSTDHLDQTCMGYLAWLQPLRRLGFVELLWLMKWTDDDVDSPFHFIIVHHSSS